MYKKINKQFDHRFSIKQSGLYAISITASCESGKISGIRGGEDLRIEINGRKLREMPIKDKPQYKDIPSTWNGTRLKGLSKTVIFVLWLEQGERFIRFIPYRGAFLEDIKIQELNSQMSFKIDKQAEDGDCRPWVTLALVDLPLKSITADVTVKWRGIDSDDMKLIIDNKIKKNNLSILHRNWIWSANIFKKFLQQERQTRIFAEDLPKGVHYIEFWADRMPILHQVELDLGEMNDKKLEKHEDGEIIYNDPEKIAEGFNKAYVLKDSAFNNQDIMGENDIQEFLDKYHEVKNKPHIAQIKFDGHRAAHWIKKAADKYSINPKLLLTKLQAEQRLIKGSKAVDPDEYQLNGAMGVGMFKGKIIEELQGFVTQITYAAKYFREYYDEAETVNFTHQDVDGKELKVVNAATYSLYKYTPHLAGPELVYDVYKMFFGVNDLGGILTENNSGSVNLKILFVVALSILILLAGVTYLFFMGKDKAIYSWQNRVDLENNLALITELQIFSQKQATEEDELYCGFRFNKIYDSRAKLLLSYNNKIIDSIDLTNSELVLPNFSEDYLTYYKPWDIDGDGKKQEFVIQEYGNCNGNFFSFVKVDKELKKIEKIPIVHQSENENFTLYVDVNKDAFRVNNGVIEAKYYDNSNTDTSFHGFVKDYYRYDTVNNKLVWFK
ncbi:hypothetical protein KJ586_04480 [Patescibacteria group bacterium]|nr:hypothetical protein [Patescibacteria group bacterium]